MLPLAHSFVRLAQDGLSDRLCCGVWHLEAVNITFVQSARQPGIRWPSPRVTEAWIQPPAPWAKRLSPVWSSELLHRPGHPFTHLSKCHGRQPNCSSKHQNNRKLKAAPGPHVPFLPAPGNLMWVPTCLSHSSLSPSCWYPTSPPSNFTTNTSTVFSIVKNTCQEKLVDVFSPQTQYRGQRFLTLMVQAPHKCPEPAAWTPRHPGPWGGGSADREWTLELPAGLCLLLLVTLGQKPFHLHASVSLAVKWE